MRRTKIVATIGPASMGQATLIALIEAGMDVCRIGLAHGTVEEHLEKVERIRLAAAEVGKPVGILVDLPGPKIRCGEFAKPGIDLSEGSTLTLVPG
jgi:pyruvate kinase